MENAFQRQGGNDWPEGDGILNSLATISKARKALASARTLDDVLTIRDKAKAVETYVKAAGESLTVQNDASEIKLRAERKAGEITSKMETAKNQHDAKAKCASNGELPATKKEQLEDVGVSKMQASRFEKLAEMTDEDFETAIEEIKSGDGAELTRSSLVKKVNGAHVGNNSTENEWYTPPIYIDAARDVMGSIDLDPASSKIANTTVKATTFYSQSNNGLTKKWTGNVWLNPPYESGVIEQFIAKLLNDSPTQWIVLVNNATETKWGQSLLQVASAVCFPKSRIRYLADDGEERKTPLQGQMFCYSGRRTQRFVDIFTEFGVTW